MESRDEPDPSAGLGREVLRGARDGVAEFAWLCARFALAGALAGGGLGLALGLLVLGLPFTWVLGVALAGAVVGAAAGVGLCYALHS
ncbi:MAG: hypothetical protein GC161_13850 [Planctomycetaceae bacterium]|nr:hypothetical protein [Planctomycetaceae bacterium]